MHQLLKMHLMLLRMETKMAKKKTPSELVQYIRDGGSPKPEDTPISTDEQLVNGGKETALDRARKRYGSAPTANKEPEPEASPAAASASPTPETPAVISTSPAGTPAEEKPAFNEGAGDTASHEAIAKSDKVEDDTVINEEPPVEEPPVEEEIGDPEGDAAVEKAAKMGGVSQDIIEKLITFSQDYIRAHPGASYDKLVDSSEMQREIDREMRRLRDEEAAEKAAMKEAQVKDSQRNRGAEFEKLTPDQKAELAAMGGVDEEVLNSALDEMIAHNTSLSNAIEKYNLNEKGATPTDDKNSLVKSTFRKIAPKGMRLLGSFLRTLGDAGASPGMKQEPGITDYFADAIDTYANEYDFSNLNNGIAEEAMRLIKRVGAENAPEWAKIQLIQRLLSQKEAAMHYGYKGR
jgi:transposase-like protein